MENMNGDYKISNPNPHAGAQFDSHYSKFSDVEYFDVSSTKSAQCNWTLTDQSDKTIKLNHIICQYLEVLS